MSWVIYTCECGNYVAEPTVQSAEPRRVAHNVELAGVVVCTAPNHGSFPPAMDRCEVVAAHTEEGTP